jgi:hypothetical protein
MRPRSLLIYRGVINVHIGAPISTEGMVDRDRDALLESTRALIREMTGQVDRPAPPAPAPSVAHA